MEKTQFSQKALTFLEQKTHNQRLWRFKYFIYSFFLRILAGVIPAVLSFLWILIGGFWLGLVLDIIISVLVWVLSLYLITLRCNDAWMNPLVYFYIRGISLIISILIAVITLLWVPEITVGLWMVNSIIGIVNLIVALIILFTPSHEFTFFTMWKWMQWGSSTTPHTTTA